MSTYIDTAGREPEEGVCVKCGGRTSCGCPKIYHIGYWEDARELARQIIARRSGLLDRLAICD